MKTQPGDVVLQAEPDADTRRFPYPLGAADVETTRLVKQSAEFAAEARKLLDEIGVRPGWRVADVGCGPLGILDLLADRVGPTGEVLGLDAQQPMVDMARERFRGVDNVRIELADVREDLPHHGFDLVHARLLLANLPDSHDIVANLARMAGPGGRVALQECDWHSWSSIPSCGAWDELHGRLARVWSGDVWLGRRLQSTMESAGLVDVKVDGTAPVLGPNDDQYRLILYFAQIQRDRLLQDGLVPEEYQRLVTAVEQHLAQPGHFVLGSVLFRAWGRVPGEPG